jgi:hypothetical protein
MSSTAVIENDTRQITNVCTVRFPDAYNRGPVHEHHATESSGGTATSAPVVAFGRRAGPTRIVDLPAATGLDAFPSEGPLSETQTPAEAESPAPAPPSPKLPVSLQGLERAGFGVERHEAVALAHSLCGVFAGIQWLPRTPFDRAPTAVEPAAIPRDAIFIDPTGQVIFADVAPTSPEHAIQCIGHTLSELLDDADPLLRARVISTAVSSPPGYESLEALAQALAAYESRDRREVLAHLHQRATGSAPPLAPPEPVPPPTTSELRRPDPAPRRVAAALEAARVQALHWLSTTAGRLTAVCGLVLVAAGLSVWVIWKATAAPPQAQIDASGTHVESPSSESVVAAEPIAAAPKRIQPNAIDRRPTRAEGAPATAWPAASTPSDFPATFQEASAPVAAAVAPAPAPAAVAPSPAPDAVAAAEPTAVGAPRGTGAAAAPRVDPSAPSETYDQSDADVTPPSALSTQMSGILSTESPGIRTEVLTIAVVVSENGQVLSVRAVNPPRNIGESLVLYGALASVKSVQFRPARKQGIPVKYRLIVPVRIPDPSQ